VGSSNELRHRRRDDIRALLATAPPPKDGDGSPVMNASFIIHKISDPIAEVRFETKPPGKTGPPPTDSNQTFVFSFLMFLQLLKKTASLKPQSLLTEPELFFLVQSVSITKEKNID